MVYGDLHIHSCYSNGYFKNFPPWVASTPKEILEKAKKNGLKVIAIADHDSLEGSREAEKIAGDFGIIVIPACEITSADGHILAYGIKKEIPKKLSAEKTIQLIHAQKGLAVAAHPFHKRPRIANGIGVGNLLFKLPFDGVEVANAGLSPKCNRIALTKSKKNSRRLAFIGGSDSHVLDFVGYGRTVFNSKIKNTQDVLKAISHCQTKGVVVRQVSFLRIGLSSLRDQFRFIFRRLVGFFLFF